MKNKAKLTKIFIDTLNELDIDIAGEENNLRKLRSDVASKNIELSDISTELVSANADINSLLNKESEIDKSIKDKEIKHIQKVNDLKSEESTLELKVKELIGYIKIKNREVADMESNINKSTKVKDSLVKLEKELKKINSEVVSKVNEYDSIDKEIKAKKIKIEELKESKKKELDEIVSEIKKQREVILPKVNSLDKREKDLKQKEGDLETIIQRWKIKYAEKGAGFKI